MQSKTVIALLLGSVALCPVVAWAGPQTAGPDLGVARVSVVNGDVATRCGFRRLDRNHSELAHRRGRFSAHNRSVEG